MVDGFWIGVPVGFCVSISCLGIFIVGIYGILSWFLGADLGVNLNFWGLSIALWVITEVLQSFYSPIVRYFSGFVGVAVMAVFGIFPNEIIQELNKYWWIILLWIPAFFINQKHQSNKSIDSFITHSDATEYKHGVNKYIKVNVTKASTQFVLSL